MKSKFDYYTSVGLAVCGLVSGTVLYLVWSGHKVPGYILSYTPIIAAIIFFGSFAVGLNADINNDIKELKGGDYKYDYNKHKYVLNNR